MTIAVRTGAMDEMIEHSRPRLTFTLANGATTVADTGRARVVTETLFDTPDARLRAAGLAACIIADGGRLTRRLGPWPPQSPTRQWPDARVEANVIKAIELPEDFRARADLRNDDSLEPIIEIILEHRPRAFAHAEGGVHAETVNGRIEAGGARIDIHEATLERTSGRPADLFVAARAFQASEPMRVEFASHAEKGALLRAGQWGEPVGKIQPDLRASMNVVEAFVAIAHACLRQLSLNQPAFNAKHRIEAVHQARVAIRRLRSALSLFAPVLRDGAFDRLRAELKWLFEILGAARDLDVLLENLELATPEQRADIEARARAAHIAAAQAVASPRVDTLLFDLAEWIAAGAWRRARAPRALRDRGLSIGRFAARRLDRRHATVTHGARGFDDLDDTALHALRVEVKKLRYMVEFLEPLALGDKARRRFGRGVESLADLQDTLGKIHDIDMGGLLLAGAGDEPAAAFVLPAPAVDRDTRLKRARREARAVVAAKPFWTLI